MLKKILVLTFTICAATSCDSDISGPSSSQNSEFKITAADGAVGDFFGYSVSISGDYAVVGAIGDDDNGDESGSAYIFRRTGTSWAQEAKLFASDGAVNNFFGESVSISGDYAVVGAYLDDDNGDESGSAYIFKRTGTSWALDAKLLALDGAAFDNFGESVSISGDHIIVGALGDDYHGSASGSVYIFKNTGTSWALETKLLASDGAAFDNFGESVSISDDYAVVGAYLDDDNGDRSGSAYIFKRTGRDWALEAKLLPLDGAAVDKFGYSVSISGDFAVVGAQSGSAYVFKRSDTSWVQEAKLVPSDGAVNNSFGNSVSISGDFVVVGAQSGTAYVYNGII